MKKVPVIVIAVVLILASLGYNVYQYKQLEAKDAELTKVERSISTVTEYLDSLTIDNFEAKVKSGADFVVYIGRPDCPDCNIFEPIFKDYVVSNQLTSQILYLNVRTYRAANTNRWNTFKATYGFTQTPAVIHFKDGKNISLIEWKDDYGLPVTPDLATWLKDNGIQ